LQTRVHRDEDFPLDPFSQLYLVGDSVEAEVEKIGTLRNRIRMDKNNPGT